MMVKEIEILEVDRKEPLTLFKGRAKVGDSVISFEGVLFNSIGGPNVNIRLDEDSRKMLLERGIGEDEINELETLIQLKIIQGELTLRE